MAIFALLVWPVVAAWLYHTRPVGQATLWTILGALLLLPVGTIIKIAPGIPQLDKDSLPNLAALVCCVLIARRPVRFWNGFGPAEVLLAIFVVSPFITSELNGDTIVVGGRVLPAVGSYDALSAVVGQLLFLLPFFLGRQILRSAEDTADILRVLVVAGLFYSVLLLFEIRMSPQLHNWVYGYQPSSFAQEVRDGGYRPMAFMGHGLLAAFFTMSTVVAATAFWRTRTPVTRLPQGGVAGYLGVVLVLSKSLGALVYALLLAPLVRWASPKTQMRVAVALTLFALTYPILRTADLVPTSAMVDAAHAISESRAQSLQFRFENEDVLLAHASKRFLFGWGRFGRSRVYDADSGKDVSVTDGRWIITMGTFGFIGFLAEFGLLALPVFAAASAFRSAPTMNDKVLLATLALLMAISIVDLVPNGMITPWTWLLAGALLGRAEALRSTAKSPSAAYVPSLELRQPHFGNGKLFRGKS